MPDDRLERARVQAHWAQAIPAEDKRATVALTRLERDGESLLVLPDGERHERRLQRLWLGGADRLFWVTLTIACGRPGRVRGGRDRGAPRLAKRFGHLAKARNDLDAYYEYYRPMQLGDPRLVGAVPGLGKSAGYFDHAIRLDNPSSEELVQALSGLRHWLDVNQHDPEYRSFQFNLAYSGHGDRPDAAAPALVLADRTLAADELAAMLLDVIPAAEVCPSTCRLDLFLDCCHAGAIAQVLGARLATLQACDEPTQRSRLELGQVYCASLADEEAFELDTAPHSLFTFAFLNECSRRRPEGADRFNLALRDIGWFTEGRQHPLLVDFTAPDGADFKFPPLYYLNRGPLAAAMGTPPPLVAPDLPDADLDPLGPHLAMATALRSRVIDLELRLAADPAWQLAYSRDELLGNRRFPFL
ncbi:MAG: hypothetical protein KF683_17030 [Rubrivivax sp.]|nr:hypothetical protein [Rubrivivax sp.]